MVFEFRGVIHRKFVDAGYSGKDIGNDILSGSLGRKRRMKKKASRTDLHLSIRDVYPDVQNMF